MSTFYRGLFFLLDIVLLNASILISFYLFKDQPLKSQWIDLTHQLIYSNLTWLFLVLVSTPYSVAKSWALSKVIKSQLSFIFIHLIVTISLVAFLNRNYEVGQIALLYLLFIPSFFLARVIIYYYRKLTGNPPEERKFIIVGRNILGGEVRKFYLVNPDLHYRFLGYIESDFTSLPLAEIQSTCEKEDVHEIFLCAPKINRTEIQKLVNYGLDSLIKVRIITNSIGSDTASIQLDQYDKQPQSSITIIPLDGILPQVLKRVFDLLFSSLFILLVMSWLTPILSIIIKLDSRGPVFFLQDRSGQNNVAFKCMKFRTMIVNAEADTKQATSNDPRITKLGAFLRKTSLDELPQFFNVFFGDMSVVGPRPHMLRHTDEYSKLIDSFMGRHYVKPGVTGLAQCLGYRGETKTLAEMENRVRLDRYYIENWTFWLDIKIIFLTVVSLIRGSDKAY